jgi:hypothetical protein
VIPSPANSRTRSDRGRIADLIGWWCASSDPTEATMSIWLSPSKSPVATLFHQP